jgi:peroxiredoxin
VFAKDYYMKKQNTILKSAATLFAALFFFSYAASANVIPQGKWLGHLQLNDSTQLPFRFEVKYDLDIYTVTFINAEERIDTRELSVNKDSVFIRMPVFDSEFRLQMREGNKMQGVWINHGRKDKNVIPFTAERGTKSLYESAGAPVLKPVLTEGKWETTFSAGTKDESKAIGIFRQEGSFLQGTFLTETGDYRFLEGQEYSPGRIALGCFDGAHAFLFTAQVRGDSIVNGHFYSGAHWHEPWAAKRNDKFELRNPDSLTYLKPGFSKVDFSFKDLGGKTVSLSDPKYKGKVVIIQVMGSWCPNCMDETKFLAPFYDRYHKKGLEVIGLAFERTDDFNKAVSNVSRLKGRFHADYDFLITMKTGAQQASEALPMLNGIMAFPTTIYIDKKGKVRKIYTGFNGPATGNAYTKYVEDTTNFVEKLLRE